MKITRLFRRRRGRGPNGTVILSMLAGGAMIVAAASGGGGSRETAPQAAFAAAPAVANVAERQVQFSMCSGSKRRTCIVDGDTIWLDGKNLRLMSFDTPEPHSAICGGAAEVALAKRASARLRELLNGNAFSVETFGLDGTGKRILATIRIHGRDVGDILIEEGLARRWPDGDEWWCQ